MAVLFDGPVPDSAAMEEFGERLAGLLRAGDLLVLTGPLGAGKTTLTRGIGRGLGVRGPVASPTFVLARTHPSLTPGGVPLVHVDAYRLMSPAELDDLDVDFERSVVVVEWGAGMLDGVAEAWLDVRIARPVGAGGGDGAAGGDGGGAVGSGADVDDDSGGGGGQDPDEFGDEPRHVTIEGYGPRWDGVAFGG